MLDWTHVGARRWQLFLLFVGLSLLTRGPFLAADFLSIDEATHLVGSWMLTGEGALFRDFVDNKPPLLYVFYALAQALFGEGITGVRLLTALAVLPGTALGVSAVLGHGRRGALAGALFLVSTAAYPADETQAVHCEVLLLLPAVWAVALVSTREGAASPVRCVASGVLLGLAVLLKQPAVFWALPLALAVRHPGRVALVALGAALPLGVTWAAFALKGTADALVFWGLTYNLGYVKNPLLPGELARRVLVSFGGFVAVNGVLAWALLRHARLLDAHRRGLVLALLVASLPPAFLGLRMFSHYFLPLCVPLALGAAPWMVDALQGGLGARVRAVARVALVGPVLVYTAVNTAVIYGTGQYGRGFRRIEARVADVLRQDVCAPGASLFVWGQQSAVYAYSRMPPASRFVSIPASVAGWVFGNYGVRTGRVDTAHLVRDAHQDLLFEDLERNRATYVVDTTEAPGSGWAQFPLRRSPRLTRYLAAHYAPLPADVAGVRVYRRLGCDAAAASGGAQAQRAP